MAKLKKGDMMPEFELQLAFDGMAKSSELIKKADHTIFWVLRYFGCTTCQLDILEMADIYDKYLEKNTQILVVLQSPASTVEEETAGSRLPFGVVCDPEYRFYNALEIRATETREERQPKDDEGRARQAARKERLTARGLSHGKYEGNEQQLPAFFVVAPDGTVEYAHYAAHAADNPMAWEGLDIIDSLK